MSNTKSKTIQQESGSGGVPNLGNIIIQSPVSHSTENTDINGCKSILHSSKTPFLVDDDELHPQFASIEPEMVADIMEAENNPSPLTSGGGDIGSDWIRPTSELKSLSLDVETGSMSASEYWYGAPFRFPPSDVSNSNDIETSTNSTTYPNLLEALTTPFIPRRPRTGLIRAPPSSPVPEDPNYNEEKPSDEESVSECKEGDDSSRDIVVVNKEDQCQSKKRNRKFMGVDVDDDDDEEELEGLNVIYVNGQKIDLNFLARVGDNAYEEELASMTGGMSRPKLVDFMDSLEGEWFGRRDRRTRVVDADEFVNALPVNWKIELALRNRGGIASIYCRRYISTSGIQFKSCKEAAFYIRDQSLANVVEKESAEEMMQVENSCQKRHKSVNEAGNSPDVPEANVNLPALENLFEVKISSLFDCSSCRISFEDIRGLEKHLASAHNETTRRFDLLTTEGAGPHASEKKHSSMSCNEPNLDKPHAEQNVEECSASRKIAKTQESVG